MYVLKRNSYYIWSLLLVFIPIKKMTDSFSEDRQHFYGDLLIFYLFPLSYGSPAALGPVILRLNKIKATNVIK